MSSLGHTIRWGPGFNCAAKDLGADEPQTSKSSQSHIFPDYVIFALRMDIDALLHLAIPARAQVF